LQDNVMNERDIFLAAIEIANADERLAYLDRECHGNAELREEIEELLKHHAQASPFLDSPAVAGDATVDRPIQGGSYNDDGFSGRKFGEAEFCKYLTPATRRGCLGRLAHYEIEQILGCGAFGIVARAFDEKLHRVIAIKLMKPVLASTSPPRKRFLREARSAAAVTHENIVAIHAVEETPIPYLVMEYIPGKTLQQHLDRTGPVEVSEVLRIGQQVAAGLAAAHAANLIHRDIKPSNILLTGGPGSRAKISDFGLARAVDDASMTKSGLIAGTPLYMAPEQARGETLDHRADLFSLGSVLYQMVGGRPPFRANNTVAVLKRVCEDTPRPLGDVVPGTPDWLESIIFKLLEKDRKDRFQSAQEVAHLLTRCQRELEHKGQLTSVEECSQTAEVQIRKKNYSAHPSKKTNPLKWLFNATLAIAFAVVIGFVLTNVEQGTHVPAPAQENARLTGDTDEATAAKEDPFAPGTLWVGEAINNDNVRTQWALSVSERKGPAFRGTVAAIHGDGNMFEFEVSGTAPEHGSGLVEIESLPIGRAKMFMRGTLRNGEIALVCSGTSRLGDKFFGSATLRPHQ
jgi:serine/threonine protein kinase